MDCPPYIVVISAVLLALPVVNATFRLLQLRGTAYVYVATPFFLLATVVPFNVMLAVILLAVDRA
jgi:uncharacterized membrane protein YGL010W